MSKANINFPICLEIFRSWKRTLGSTLGRSISKVSIVFISLFLCWFANIILHFRICDVIPRGFSGYNSRWCRLLMPKVFEEFRADQVACVTILLGSNDSSHADSPSKQHVPLEEFKANLVAMIGHLETIGIKQDRVVLMSPPNYHDEDFMKYCREMGRPHLPRKSDQATKEYAQAVAQVAHEKKITFLDLNTIFRGVANDNRSLFIDGLHLSESGAQLLFKHLQPLVVDKVERFLGRSLEEATNYPYYGDINVEHPEKSLKA